MSTVRPQLRIGVNLAAAAIEMLAAAAGLAAGGGSSQGAVSGNSFQMTAESYSRYLDLAGSTKEKLGIVSGVPRQSDGTIDTVVNLVKSSPVSPAAMANVPALAAAVAIRAAIHNLEVLLESVDAKLDVAIRDYRNAALGNIQGTTHILDKAFGYFEEIGSLNATLWDQVAGQAAGLVKHGADGLAGVRPCLPEALRPSLRRSLVELRTESSGWHTTLRAAQV